ncbi:tRNA uridine-5-carboxymethylaminomethyl(34) synthesis GTPase MnmE [Helicobacter monodelphidis]|uniref:tRNA uridine-5-carboxymethylaminomethyl(34) synthesis GTPase MnmE n=1 Tax=Helicobacter sp. 15-1451 TaxID=2004995 RepID=UPI000DCDC9A0|nr:tRNA uridine-5-carboxymethylaminomethyl(34) synthesis GTPase MnmE [Helicobacter sp. 15-1451]RAX56951.1 tRNA uridine-5-carboxymethylaminomethyl(34) synthesis GTPase MnmE [Helicobacter sp. 15-1451]
MYDTIVAISTPLGMGALAVIKISGDFALPVVLRLCRLEASHSIVPRLATLKTIYDSAGDILDEAIVIYFQSPCSYTAEDVVEVQCHGGSFIVQQILDEILSMRDIPIRLAKAGEFTQRALLNGRIDITQAEAIAQITHIKDIATQKLLMRQLKGDLREFIQKEREELMEFLAHSEVVIDYAEEDLPSNILSSIQEKIADKIFASERILQASSSFVHHQNGFQVAFVGRPNTGKSSLLNAMLLKNRAIISDVPGTTRDSIEESMTLNHHHIRLVDTAGIRQSDDLIEQEGVNRSKDILQNSDIILALFDSSEPLQDEDKEILELLRRIPAESIVIVLNKSDCEVCIDREVFSVYKQVEISAKYGKIQPLIKVISEILEKKNYSTEIILSSHRQLESFRIMAQELRESQVPLQEGELELFSFHIRAAIEALEHIVKPFCVDELFDVMFSRFCLGK